MKKLFTSIRQGKLDEAAAVLGRKPELISCLAKALPGKDHEQSPLMVAIKSDNLEAAHLLLDRGADVNFRDEINPFGSNFSAPVWYDAVGQCFMRAKQTVEPGLERSKGCFLLLRRLLDMGVGPNQKTSSGRQNALNKYEQYAYRTFSSDPLTREMQAQKNRQLREMLRAVLDELLPHGVNIHDFTPANKDGLPASSILFRNPGERQERLDGLCGLDLDSDAFQSCTVKCRGKERLVQPSLTVEDSRQRYETQWRELEPFLRSCYE